jgi:diguanylate cyclase (GGDEF)-like protein
VSSAFAQPHEYVIATIILLGSVGLYVHALMRAEVYHRRGSVIDPLTGLLNRSTLAHRFDELCEQARVADAPVAIAILDLDHFKRINDDHGHERGDAVLRDVAVEMRQTLRSFELAYRLGGEEFLVILPGLDETAAVDVADNVRCQIAAAAPGGIAITVSAGVAAAAGADLSYAALFALADARLYEAKSAGRDCVVPQPASSVAVPIAS